MSSPDDWVVVQDPAEVAQEELERLERLLQDPITANQIRREHEFLLTSSEIERRATKNKIYIEDPSMVDAMLRWEELKAPLVEAERERLEYERETREKLERLLQDPKIATEIKQEYQLLLDDAERQRRATKHGIYIEGPDMEDAMFGWEDKKAAAVEAERVRQRERRQKWRSDAQGALEEKRRSKLRRFLPSQRVPSSFLRRRRRKSASPMERWRIKHAKKSRIVKPGLSKIVRETRRRRRVPRKRKRSPFVKKKKGGKRTRHTKRTRRTLRRKRRKTRKHK